MICNVEDQHAPMTACPKHENKPIRQSRKYLFSHLYSPHNSSPQHWRIQRGVCLIFFSPNSNYRNLGWQDIKHESKPSHTTPIT